MIKNITLRCIQEQAQKDEDIPDSLKYTTKNGRTVYGGGGVTPDSIIKIDNEKLKLQCI